jgi:electron transport complex protein RnfE
MSPLQKFWSKAREGLFRQTPPLFVVLGLCPSLAVTTAAINGLVMGLATTGVLLCTALVTLAIRKMVPSEVRIPVYTVVIASFVTIADLVLAGLVPPVHKVLGVFIPLIIVNCIILARVEGSFTKDQPIEVIGDALGWGLGFTWALLVIGTFRELLASGSVFGKVMMPEGFVPWSIMQTPPGAFVTMGFIVAVIQALRSYSAQRKKASVTGKASKQAEAEAA